MIIEDVEQLKQWLYRSLSPICDTDPAYLSTYVVALVKKDKPEYELQTICINCLNVFLQNNTRKFVAELFKVLRTGLYKKQKAQVASQERVTVPDTLSTTMSAKLNAKQRTIQNVKERLRQKLDSLLLQEEALYSMIRSYVSEARDQTEAVLSMEDSGHFLQRYSGVEQHLDMAFNTCERLIISAEDMIEPDNCDTSEVTNGLPTEICSSKDKDNSEHPEVPHLKLSPTSNESESVKCEASPEVKAQISLKVMVNEDTQTSDHANSEAGDVTEVTESKAKNSSVRIPAIAKESCEKAPKSKKLNPPHLKSLNDEVSISDSVQVQTVVGKSETNVDIVKQMNEKTKDKTTECSDGKKDVSAKQKKSQPHKAKEVPKSVRNILKEKLTNQDFSSVKEYKDDSGGVADVDSNSTDASGLLTDVQKLKVLKDKGNSVSTSSSQIGSPKKSPQKAKTQKKGKKKGKMLNPSKDSPETQPHKKYVETETAALREKAQPSVECQPKETVQTKSLENVENEFSGNPSATITDTSISSENDVSKISKENPSVAQKGKQESVKEEKRTETKAESPVDEVMKGEGPTNATRPQSASEQASKHSLVPDTLPSGRITPVVVSEMVSPWCFFLNKNGSQLPDLMEQICKYMQGEGEATGPMLTHPEMGTLCLARYSKDLNYYRAYIMQTYTAGRASAVSEVDVLYVDYGNRERLKVTDLRPLPDQFSILPSQAICCSLAEVMPGNKYCVWTDSSILLFRQYVLTNQQLSCTVTCRSSDPRVPMLVDLSVSYPMPSSPYGSFLASQISVSSLLVNAGLAKPVAVSEQIGLLAKSGEAADVAAILCSNVAMTTSLASTELPPEVGPHVKESHRQERKVEDTKKGQSKRKDVRNKAKVLSKSETDHKNIEITIPTTEPAQKVELEGKGQKVEDPAGLMVTPRSEYSETESQQGETKVKAINGKSHLRRIKEELDDADRKKEENDCKVFIKADASSVLSMSDLDLTSGADLQLDDMTFDLDNIHLSSQGQEVMLAHIRSPGEFYVHIISQKSGQTLDLLMKNLNAMFEKANRRKLMTLSKTFVCKVGKLCCAQFTQDDNFYRGVIKSVTAENHKVTGRVLVHYIDFGDEEWLPKRRIYPLPAQFSSIPRLALKCCLAYIVPLDSGTGGAGVSEGGDGMALERSGWSEKATEEFIKLGGMEKTLTMHIVQGNLADQKHSYHDSRCSLKVMLVDNTGPEEVCINLDLIRGNLAKLSPEKGSSEVVTDVPQPVEEQDDLKDWNPMEEDFLSSRNKYDIDVDDVGVATTGHKARDDRICKFYSRGRKCFRGEACPYRHIDPNSVEPVMRDEVYAICDNQEEVIPTQGSWVAMEISTILTPARFYSLLPMGIKSLDNLDSESSLKSSKSVFEHHDCDETLDDLQDALNVEYSKKASSGGSEYLRALGEIVAARFSQDHQWYRARVVEVDDERVRVFYLDFGNTEWLPERELCDIKPEFLHLPFQALECFLDNVQPTSTDATWSKEAVQYFRELVDGKTLVAHIKSRSWNGRITVELYDTSGDDDVNIGDKMVAKGYALVSEATTETSANASETTSLCSTDTMEILVPG